MTGEEGMGARLGTSRDALTVTIDLYSTAHKEGFWEGSDGCLCVLRWLKLFLACGLEFKHQILSLVSTQTCICGGSILFTGRLCLGNLG